MTRSKKPYLLAAALALMLAASTSTASAESRGDIHLTGASPTYHFIIPSQYGGLADYTYTNMGDGNTNYDLPVSWSYIEQGTMFGPTTDTVHAAAYTITTLFKHRVRHKSFVLHVIGSSVVTKYDHPAQAPCSTGTFSERLQEGAEAHGTFAPLLVQGQCLPTYRMDLVIDRGGDADRFMRGEQDEQRQENGQHGSGQSGQGQSNHGQSGHGQSGDGQS